jgi:hypothetical protein
MICSGHGRVESSVFGVSVISGVKAMDERIMALLVPD